ncbi:MAG: TIGR03936 family radical SAM-associated protein [Lachnospiraceae bacterium]|nr:TIGR03936 family radical SAM-associated protein [Lachnospiraceae bacterium]
MTLRIRFAKYGALRFIGHLDVMRYFQKVIRRADLPVRYSQGFTPHQIMTFAHPLSLGVSSDAEYMEVDFTEELSPEEVFERMSARMSEGFSLLSCKRLPDVPEGTRAQSLMSLVTAAEYMVSWKDGYPAPPDEDTLRSAIREFYSKESIVVEKSTKKTTAETDIKPFIYRMYMPGDAFTDPSDPGFTGDKMIKRTFDDGIDNLAHADRFENGRKFFVCVASGSADNIKPGLVTEALCEVLGYEYNKHAFALHRMETYKEEGGSTGKDGADEQNVSKDCSEGEKRSLVPLDF